MFLTVGFGFMGVVDFTDGCYDYTIAAVTVLLSVLDGFEVKEVRGCCFEWYPCLIVRQGLLKRISFFFFRPFSTLEQH